jgi:hypothetical protein
MIQEGIPSGKIKIIAAGEDGTRVRNLSNDGFIRRRFHFPKNWRLYGNTSTIETVS